MAPSELGASGLAVALLAATGCTVTGLGDYEVPTCDAPVGAVTPVQAVGELPFTPSMSNSNGAHPVAAYASGGCVEAVASSGYVQATCSLLSGELVPQQPWVVSTGSGFAAAAVATTAPCTQGRVSFQSLTSQGLSAPLQAQCTTGAALPAVAPAGSGSDVFVAWYETPVDARMDPIQACATASPAALRVSTVTGATTGAQSMGPPLTLTLSSTSVRPPAMTALSDGTILLAAPDGDAVSLFPLGGAMPGGGSVPVRALTKARAVSIATATDGSSKIAVVAEIGCAPQTIAMSVGTLRGGFGPLIRVEKAASGADVQPTVAWVPAESGWIVSWIATSGGPHVLARRFDAAGTPVGTVIDPSAPATAAAAGSDATVLAYQPSGGGSFVKVALGCRK
jgi:hypothetical protein